MRGPVVAASCPQCAAPLPPFGGRKAQVCGHCGATVQPLEEPGSADLERRVSALERLRAPIRRRYGRRYGSSGDATLSTSRAFALELAAVVGMSAAGAVVDGDAPLSGALAFGAVTGIFVLGLVLAGRSGPPLRRRGRTLQQR